MLILATQFGCAAGQPAVIQELDAVTAVTYTYSRTPLILSPETPLDPSKSRDYVQLGAIEVNRAGSRRYYLWLGISIDQTPGASGGNYGGFPSIVLLLGDRQLQLEMGAQSHAAIGVSEPIYRKLFPNSADAYYRVTLDQIRLISEADSVKLLSGLPATREFVPLYKQATARDDLAEFLRRVSE